MENLNELSAAWMANKKLENEAMLNRYAIEEKIRTAINLKEDEEGTTTIHQDHFVIKVTSRFNKKIDAEKLQELAKNHDLIDELSIFFRWKPEINSAIWKAANKDIKLLLSDAITSTPAKPSFTITNTETK